MNKKDIPAYLRKQLKEWLDRGAITLKEKSRIEEQALLTLLALQQNNVRKTIMPLSGAKLN